MSFLATPPPPPPPIHEGELSKEAGITELEIQHPQTMWPPRSADQSEPSPATLPRYHDTLCCLFLVSNHVPWLLFSC
uniref:Uncharacterized protein n=1 Tax=Salmo trutta TaxID=8032 RepID=A0A674CMF4_SALTR